MWSSSRSEPILSRLAGTDWVSRIADSFLLGDDKSRSYSEMPEKSGYRQVHSVAGCSCR